MVGYSNTSLKTGLKKPIYGPKCWVFEWSAKSFDLTIWIPDTHSVQYLDVRYSDGNCSKIDLFSYTSFQWTDHFLLFKLILFFVVKASKSRQRHVMMIWQKVIASILLWHVFVTSLLIWKSDHTKKSIFLLKLRILKLFVLQSFLNTL